MATGGPVRISVLADAREFSAGIDRAKADLGQLERSAKNAGDTVDKEMGSMADATDAAGSNASQLAGAFGDVAGGLGLIGLGGFSDELEAAAPALMLVAGAADIAAVAHNTLSLSTIKSKVATISKAVSEKAAAAGTKAYAAAQWVLNAAMSANPIGLVVLAIAGLVAGIVIAYKKSETFRNVVGKAFGVVKRVVGPVINFLKTAVPAAFQFIVNAATLIPRKLIGVGGKFLDAGKKLIGKLIDGFKSVGKLGLDIGKNLFDGIRNGINKAIDGVNNFLPDKIGLKGLPDINLPDNPIPHIPALASGGIVNRATLALIGEAGPEAVVPLNGRYGFGNTYVIKVTAPVGSSPADVGRSLVRYLDAYERAGGRRRA